MFDLIAERTVGVPEFVPFGSGLGEIELRGLLVTGARCRRVRAGAGGGVGLRRRGGRERLLVDLGHLLVPLPLDVDPGQVVEVVGGARGVLQVLDDRRQSDALSPVRTTVMISSVSPPPATPRPSAPPPSTAVRVAAPAASPPPGAGGGEGGEAFA